MIEGLAAGEGARDAEGAIDGLGAGDDTGAGVEDGVGAEGRSGAAQPVARAHSRTAANAFMLPPTDPTQRASVTKETMHGSVRFHKPLSEVRTTRRPHRVAVDGEIRDAWLSAYAERRYGF